MIKRVDEQTIVKFGSGDINIIPGILTDTEIGIVGLREQEPREIGLNNGDKAPDNVSEFKVILQFDKSESIDVLVYALNEAKKMMKNRNEIIKKVEKVEDK